MATVLRIAAVSYLDTIPFLYGIEHALEVRAELSLSDFPASIEEFRTRKADIALVPAHVVPSLDGARIVTDYCLGAPSPVLVEALAAEEAPLAPLLAAGHPFAYAVWVARAETDPALVEALQHALTHGLEHTYEAVAAAGYADRPYDAYAYLTQADPLFDEQKSRALRKLWAAGLKTAPRANPG